MSAPNPQRSEVWLFDFGMAAKVRPAVVMSISYLDADRAIIGVVPHTTTLRGSQFEIVVPVRFLEPGAFLLQGFATMPPRHFIRRLGSLNGDQMNLIENDI